MGRSLSPPPTDASADTTLAWARASTFRSPQAGQGLSRFRSRRSATPWGLGHPVTEERAAASDVDRRLEAHPSTVGDSRRCPRRIARLRPRVCRVRWRRRAELRACPHDRVPSGRRFRHQLGVSAVPVQAGRGLGVHRDQQARSWAECHLRPEPGARPRNGSDLRLQHRRPVDPAQCGVLEQGRSGGRADRRLSQRPAQTLSHMLGPAGRGSQKQRSMM